MNQNPKVVRLATWGGRVRRAIKRGSFFERDYRDVAKWVSDPIGEGRRRGSIVTPNGTGVEQPPSDPRLVFLGTEFFQAVRSNKPQEAKLILRKIEHYNGPDRLKIVGVPASDKV